MKTGICVLLTFFAACCSPMKTEPVFKDGAQVSVRGMITLIGNEPLSRLAIRSADGQNLFFLPAELKKSRRDLIGKNVSISSRVSVRELVSADGKHRRFEYTLSDPVITDN